MSFVLQGWCCECGGVVEKERREIEGERLTFRGSEWTDLSGRKVRTDCASDNGWQKCCTRGVVVGWGEKGSGHRAG